MGGRTFSLLIFHAFFQIPISPSMEYNNTRDLPGKCSGDGAISGRCPKKYVISYFFQTSLFLLRLPLLFGPLIQGEGTYLKKLEVKTFPFSSSNRGTQRCNGRKSRLSKLLSFVPNQRLPYKLVNSMRFRAISLGCITLTTQGQKTKQDVSGIEGRREKVM